MEKKVVLIGHCGPDSSYLRMTLRNVSKEVKVLAADDEQELSHALKQQPDLLLVNRDLGGGFADPMGVNLIKRLRATHPDLKAMLVSNYPDAQAAAAQAGALPGFGKRELGSARVLELLRTALG
jgi:DNA-binding NarL/FixJ family response regulator